jgi:lysine/arginine/ornithine transport system substrate-binding protein
LLTLAALGAVGCSGGRTAAHTASSGSCLKEIQKSGYLTAAFEGAPPDNFVSPSGGPVTGIIPDILRAFMRREHIPTLKAISMPFSSMIPALKVGRIDINGSEISYTPARATQVTFTGTIFWDPDTLVVGKGNPHHIHSLRDLAGLQVGTYAGTIYADYLRQAQQRFHFHLSILSTSNELLGAIQSGHLSAGMMEEVGAAYALKKNPSLGLELASRYTPASPREAAAVHLAVRKQCTDLAAAFDKAYGQIVADGTRDRILSKWGLTPVRKFTEYAAG